jgi:hypothetical protein
VSDSETTMELGPYSTGDIRACGDRSCDYPVVWTGHYWVHVPIDGLKSDPKHQAFPYPEHKHKYRILGTDGIVYYYECNICIWRSSTSRKRIRYLLTGKWDRDIYAEVDV